jgi:hypothetical protein
MKKIVALLVILSAACSDEEAARRTLDNAGFTDIETTGYEAWSCGKDDSTSTGFRARNPRGKIVTGVVCCGYSKGCTVRF